MADEGMKEYFRVLHAFLSHNAAYLLYCDCKKKKKGYRKKLKGFGLTSNMIDYQFAKYFRLFKDPRETDFDKLWESKKEVFNKRIYNFQDISKKYLKSEVKSFFSYRTTSPTEKDIVDFINRKIINQQFGNLVGSGKKVLLSVDLNHSTVKGLTSEFEKLIKNYELKPPPINNLKNKHFHLLLVVLGTYELASDEYKRIYNKPPPTDEVTFYDNPKRSENTVLEVQFNIMNGNFPDSSNPTIKNNQQFRKMLESGMLLQK